MAALNHEDFHGSGPDVDRGGRGFIVQGAGISRAIVRWCRESGTPFAGIVSSGRLAAMYEKWGAELLVVLRQLRLPGLTPATMGAGALARFYMAHVMDHRSVMKKGFRDAGIDGAAAQVRQGAGWLVVTSRDESALALIETGRRFERMALQLRERKFAAQPMSQTLEEEIPGAGSSRRSSGSQGFPQLVLRVRVRRGASDAGQSSPTTGGVRESRLRPRR